jgi:hypothetical protein
MAEGLDQAADAFRNEIAPAADRSRDDTGRFTGPPKPESMFEPRPVEGDEKTGDTRDGGEDARLAAMERRVADGRAEEGDEQRELLPDDAARARRAAGDGEREQRPDGQEPEGKLDEQGKEGEGDEPRWQITIDGKPVEKLEVQVDGQPAEVTLEEALKGYVDGATYEKRVAELGQAANVIGQEYHRTVQARDALIQRITAHEEEYAALLPPEPNWDEFYNQNPTQARQTQKNYEAAQQKLNSLRQQRMQLMQEAQQENAQKVAEYARNGFEQFKRDRRFADNVQLNNELGAMRKIGLEYGFNEQELSTVYDPRMLAVLHDASLYRRALAAKPRPVLPDKGRTLAPGSARPIGSATRKGIDDLQSKLAKSGKLDDASALFQRLIR